MSGVRLAWSTPGVHFRAAESLAGETVRAGSAAEATAALGASAAVEAKTERAKSRRRWGTGATYQRGAGQLCRGLLVAVAHDGEDGGLGGGGGQGGAPVGGHRSRAPGSPPRVAHRRLGFADRDPRDESDMARGRGDRGGDPGDRRATAPLQPPLVIGRDG